MCSRRRFSIGLGAIVFIVAVTYGAFVAMTGSPTLDNTAVAQQTGKVPGAALGNTSDSALWRAMRRGVQGDVSIPNKQAGVLIQSEGENWRAFRNGPLSQWGGWGLLGMIALLAIFFAIRGRIRIEAGPSGRTVERFNFIDRFAHWLTAGTFVVLGVTGLNLLYGRHILLPILGPDVFSTLTLAGKYVHNFVSFAFMLGIVLMFVLWVRHNMPSRSDVVWLLKGGGMFVKGVHPPSRKFNAGQKILFWIVVLGGLSLTISGISLLFPFEISMFSATFAALNVFGLNLPTDMGPIQEMQLSHRWHTVVAIVLIAVIVAHIYIGSLGMEGAFDAMGTGQVDENWAREHHSLWVAEMKGETGTRGSAHPAE